MASLASPVPPPMLYIHIMTGNWKTLKAGTGTGNGRQVRMRIPICSFLHNILYHSLYIVDLNTLKTV